MTQSIKARIRSSLKLFIKISLVLHVFTLDNQYGIVNENSKCKDHVLNKLIQRNFVVVPLKISRLLVKKNCMYRVEYVLDCIKTKVVLKDFKST